MSENLFLALLGETADICPTCRAALSRRPQRKTKCPMCSALIFVKLRPQDRVRVLATESDANEIEEQWLALQGLSGKPEHNVTIKATLRVSLDQASMRRDWGIYYGALIRLGQIHQREGDARTAVELFGRALYLGAAGASNPGFDAGMRGFAPGAVAALDIAWETLGCSETELREMIVVSAQMQQAISKGPIAAESAWKAIRKALHELG